MKVGIVMGSISDKAIGEKVITILKKFDVDYEIRVISAHRTPDRAVNFAKNAEGNGMEVIIAIAGKAAHLAGVMAGITVLPVIGIPAKSSTMDGLDSLLSVVQMPKGIPVATVAIDGGENGGLLAVQMLSIKYPELRKRFTAYKKEIMAEVIKMDEEIQSLRR
ncbi:MAG TPA: 5-(carboxyamino)imidazole ribonucleotide mutase [Clostridia bacterium]|nr:5-(carboxyamino)imidazole ribonucleotide mutase [Clostridia bacterium]